MSVILRNNTSNSGGGSGSGKGFPPGDVTNIAINNMGAGETSPFGICLMFCV